MNKFFSNIQTLEDLKKVYRKLALKLHPDNNNGNDTDFKSMQNEYDKLYQSLYHTKDKKDTKQNASYEDIRKESDLFKDIISALMKFDDITIDIVGSWLWVYGNTYACKDIIKGLGFKWASKKQKWYYHDINDGWEKKGKALNYAEITSIHGCDTVKVANNVKKEENLLGSNKAKKTTKKTKK